MKKRNKKSPLSRVRKKATLLKTRYTLCYAPLSTFLVFSLARAGAGVGRAGGVGSGRGIGGFFVCALDREVAGEGGVCKSSDTKQRVANVFPLGKSPFTKDSGGGRPNENKHPSARSRMPGAKREIRSFGVIIASFTVR